MFPTADESQILLTVEDWKFALARNVANPSGKPIVGIDLGGGRSWSAAAAIWENGRCESLAVAPGIPSLAEQEKRDKVPRGTYQRIRNLGIAGGKRGSSSGLTCEGRSTNAGEGPPGSSAIASGWLNYKMRSAHRVLSSSRGKPDGAKHRRTYALSGR